MSILIPPGTRSETDHPFAAKVGFCFALPGVRQLVRSETILVIEADPDRVEQILPHIFERFYRLDKSRGRAAAAPVGK